MARVSAPWATEDSTLPEFKKHALIACQAALSTAKGIIFPSSDDTLGLEHLHTGKKVDFGADKELCPFATTEESPKAFKRRQPLLGDVGDRFATGSDKVGAVPVAAAVYAGNLAESRARIIAARAAANKGASILSGQEEEERPSP